MTIVIDGSGTITGASTLATTVASPTLTTPNINSAQFATVTGTAPIYPCRAWVNFNGTGTVAINASGNVSSVTDNGTGDYTVNFTTAIVAANYASVFGWGMTNATITLLLGTGSSIAPTTSALRFSLINSATGAALDVANISVSFFR